MEIRQAKIREYLQAAAKIDFRTIYTAERLPLPAREKYFVCMLKAPRLIFPTSKTKRIRFAENGEIQDRIFTPGEALVIPSQAWSAEVWDCAHSMISVVFNERYIRVLWINHNGVPPPPDGPDIFYHTVAPLNTAGSHLLQSVLTSQKNTLSRLLCFKALLQMVLEAVEYNQKTIIGKEAFTWDCIQDYLETHFCHDISRESIAKTLQIHPAHLSRLVHKMTGMALCRYLIRLRMERARILLLEKNSTIDEIAAQCGYSYTSYFIRQFHAYFAESPGRYREKYHYHRTC